MWMLIMIICCEALIMDLRTLNRKLKAQCKDTHDLVTKKHLRQNYKTNW